MSYSVSHQDREKEEESTQGNSLYLRSFAHDTGDHSGPTESKETSELSLKWTQRDKVSRNHILAFFSSILFVNLVVFGGFLYLLLL